MKKNTFKIMMLGEIGVGKTSIVRRLMFNTFDTTYKATIGVDIYSFLLEGEKAGLNIDLELLIWDVDGELGPGIFNHIYLRGAGGACIVSDVTRLNTHRTALGLAEGFQNNLPGRPIILVINKIDLLFGEQPVGLRTARPWDWIRFGQVLRPATRFSTPSQRLAASALRLDANP